jgi:hypothetical protein
MTYDEAVIKLLDYLEGDFQNYESSQRLNAFNRYEFRVTKLDGTQKMVQIGEDILEKEETIIF